ncbi:hypothetical protein EVAR_33182_1 [Eumeta japonica]|uniref:Uncharacterized protein n=1 Tax=Eumeta variegata TaxID=151549 RepID=A0A4C1W4S6_EUMVA|nr:hypothetical protein EVAR_33182_1 [Eumeta japonica]
MRVELSKDETAAHFAKILLQIGEELGNQIEVMTVGSGSEDIAAAEVSGAEDEESVPVCVPRDASVDDICADAAVAPMKSKTVRGDQSPTQVLTFFYSY